MSIGSLEPFSSVPVFLSWEESQLVHIPTLCTIQEILWALFCPEDHPKTTASLKHKVLFLCDAISHSLVLVWLWLTCKVLFCVF